MGILFVCLLNTSLFNNISVMYAMRVVPGNDWKELILDSFHPRQTTKASPGENGNLKYLNCI